MKHIHTKCQVCGDWSFCHRNLEFVDEVLRARDWYFLGNSWRWRARHDCGSPLSTQPIKQWRKRHLRQVKFEKRFRHFAINFSMRPCGYSWISGIRLAPMVAAATLPAISFGAQGFEDGDVSLGENSAILWSLRSFKNNLDWVRLFWMEIKGIHVRL